MIDILDSIDFREEDHDHEVEFSKAQRKSCPICKSFWGKPARLFESEEAFKSSEYYGGGDTVVNDPNGVTIAVWAGKDNLGKQNWMCVPIHPNCGCEFVPTSFSNGKPIDYLEKLDYF